ncbi:MAG: recombinase family protein [Candidatus Auribacterota bacterium]
MKAIILARVSTEEQTEGHSIPAQVERARAYCLYKGFEVQSEHPFDESSVKDKRSKFNSVIEEIKRSKETIALIVETVDRLQRSFKESVLFDEFRKQGKVELHFIRENLVIHKESNSADLIRWDMAVMFARSYVLQISDNVKRTQAHKLQNGEYPGVAPFGYKNITDENGKKDIVPHPLNAEIVKKIYEWYSCGVFSMNEIRDKLNEELNLKIYKSKIEFILKLPFYYGMMQYKEKLYPHRYLPLITKETFDLVQERRAIYKKKPFKKAGFPYLYRGVIKCGHCGCIFTPERKKGKYVYYHCTEAKGKHGTQWIREEDLTEQFSAILENIRIPDELAEAICENLKSTHQGKKEYHTMVYTQLTNEYKKYENRIETMYEDKLDGRITQDYYDKKLTEYRNKQKEIQSKLANLEIADEKFYLTAEYILKLAQRASQLFKSSEPKLKQQILDVVLQNCYMDGVSLCYQYRSPFDQMAKGAISPKLAPRTGQYTELFPLLSV